jgi:homoserine acetyltransferase
MGFGLLVFTLRNFPLTDGTIMPEATIAYETYGWLAADGRNAILCTHDWGRRGQVEIRTDQTDHRKRARSSDYCDVNQGDHNTNSRNRHQPPE